MSQIDLGRTKRRKQADSNFFAEHLEDRTLFTFLLQAYINSSLIQTPSGSTETLIASVEEHGAGEVESLSGNVSIEWWNGTPLASTVDSTDKGGPPIATAPEANEIDSTNALDTSLTVTLNESDAAAAGPATAFAPGAEDANGNPLTGSYYTLIAEFDGGSGYPATWAEGGTEVQFTGSASQPKLAFIQNPSNTAEGDTIKPAVRVAIEDSSGNITTSASDVVAVSVASGSGTLSGTLSEPAVKGIATFSDLSIDAAGNYTLTATDSSGLSTTGTTSSSFNITAGKLVFLKPPTDGSAGDPIQPNIEVALETGKGKIDTSDSTTEVTLSPIGTTSANPITGNTATLQNGIATFSDLVLTKPGFYQLQAADGGDASSASGKFKIAGDKLFFKTPPVSGDVNTPIPVTVDIYNSKGAPDANATTDLQLSLNTISGGVGAVLSGTTTVAFSGGIAAFPPTAGLAINTPGTYTLTATEEEDSGGVLVPTNTTTPITSKPFKVSGFHLVFLKQPTNTAVNAALTLTVAIEDVKNKVDTTDNLTAVNIGFNTVVDGADAQLLGSTTVNVSSGIATFSGTSNVIKFDTIGTYTLTADDGTDPVITSKPIKIEGSHLVFSIPPRPASVNQPLQFAITEEDASNKVVTTDNSSELSIRVVDAATGALAQYSQGGTTSAVLSDGILNYGNAQTVTIAQIGTFNITATAYTEVLSGGVLTPIPTIEPVTFKNLKITGYKLALIAKPPSTNTVNQPIPFTVAIEDDSNKINHSDNMTGLQISLKSYTPGANRVYSTAASVPVLTNGEYIFDANQFFEITQPGKFSLTVTAIDPSTNSVISTTDPVTSSVFVVKN
jgi:hypothetical protein